MTVGQKEEKSKRHSLIALDLFKIKSFNDISMAEIAKKANVSKGTLFNYYETKESIFKEFLLTGYQDYFSTLNKKINKMSDFSITEFKQLLLKETHILIKEHTVLIRLNALRSPILEGHANAEKTLIWKKEIK